MNKQTLTALKGSIRKWEGILAGTILDLAASNCPLCDMFKRARGCGDCPVRKKTGQHNCKGTPYVNWVGVGGHWQTADTAEKKTAAAAELIFLQSLLPKPKKRSKRAAS